MTLKELKKSSGVVLDHQIIGKIRGNFFVPAYQRGYRWTKEDVQHLLDDIWESKQANRDYSLQPVVVKLINGIDGEGGVTASNWELIDGQQRLTTLYLVFQFMKNMQWRVNTAPYTLRYATRPDSADYLQTLDSNQSKTNIDFFHLHQAYERIRHWFTDGLDAFAQEVKANEFLGHLNNKVKIIWYQTAADPDISVQESISESIALFTRLNVGRIALTDAELIKAALLSAAREHCTDRSSEIASQWDAIERDLHQADIWTFVSGLDPNASDEKYPTRINLLLDTLADAEKKPISFNRPRYYTFDTLRTDIDRGFLEFWKKVVALHAQIMGWYEQPTIYNKIGFLVSCKVPFTEIIYIATQPSERKPRKSEFNILLDDRIRKYLDLTVTALDDLSYEEKKQDYPKLLKILLLLNVETSTCSGHRFPFSQHIVQIWSLEHIHAQNAEVLKKAEQWKVWLELQKPALNAVTSEKNAYEIAKIKSYIDAAIIAITEGKTGNFTGEKFSALSTCVLKLLNKEDSPDHSIRNMALLSCRDNSSLSNSVFEVKRQMILKLDSDGKYVPICTRNVFLKYYADADAQQPHYWGEKDKDSYIKIIRKILNPYFTRSA